MEDSVDFGKCLFNSLQIGVHGKYKDRPRFPDGEFTPELYNYIKNALDTETFTHLYGYYNDDAIGITVEYENGLSYIVIHNDLTGFSYTYINLNNKEDKTQVDIGGSTISKKYVCDNKTTILNIIVIFLTTGEPCSQYEWLELKE